jgi:hypothetical protein
VVVENDGSLKMCVPPGLLVLRHVHWRFRRAPAVEAYERQYKCSCTGERRVLLRLHFRG